MSQLLVNTPRVYEAPPGFMNSLPVKASTEIFLGSAVGSTAGYARQLVAGDIFGGFADEHVNNSVATDGLKTVPCIYVGRIQLAVTSVAVTDIDAPVYASDGNTFTLTAGSNTLIGKVHRFVSSGICIVSFNVQNP